METTTNDSASSEEKYFNIDIRGLGYVNHAEEVTLENGDTFLKVRVSLLQGRRDNVEYLRLDCYVVGSAAKEMVNHLIASGIDPHERKVLALLRLSGLGTAPFIYPKTSERAGQMGVNLKTRILGFDWIRVDGEELALPEGGEDSGAEDAPV